ncbi:MAG: multiheme c-type cytochrome [Planctomycetota bacterium]
MSSQTCFTCHANDPTSSALRDAAGRGVAPFDLWQASMMANATRDPLWRAEVSVEIAATPSLRSAIEAKCISCHAPMAKGNADAAGETLSLADLGRNDVRAQLALDGVSCSLCHQITAPTDVSATFGGAYAVNDQREIYGPHDQPLQTPMSVRTGYLPQKGDHVRRSAHCASCHTLETHAVRADGTPTNGTLLEQSPYLEWQNSAFNDETATPGPDAASCQSCHVPSSDRDGNAIRTQIAARGQAGFPINPRDPVGRHVFVGGNTLVPRILRDQRAALQPLAPDAALDAMVAESRDLLQRSTARVSVQAPTRTGALLRVPVRVENLSGHKLPTGHPVRRAWLRVVVRDAQGQVVFASGEHDAEGRLVDQAGRPLASEAAGGPTQPHRQVVTASDQVQVYQSLMRDEAGAATFLLLRAEGYLKDDRLLPRGWSAQHLSAARTAPVGVAGDADFQAGEDTVTYELSAPLAAGPYRVEASLLYQPLGARFAAELFRFRTPEVEAFKSYYQAAPRTPELVASATRQVP